MLLLHCFTINLLILLIVINWGEGEILFLDGYSFLFIFYYGTKSWHRYIEPVICPTTVPVPSLELIPIC